MTPHYHAMKRFPLALCLASLAGWPAAAAPAWQQHLDEYFKAETTRIESASLKDASSLEEWRAALPKLRSQYSEMLGLEPMPPRTELRPVVTGKIEFEDFTVEKIHFQAMPRVYVTANLYLPRGVSKPVPAILYVCGHARVFTNGVSCGNKTAYQHHGIWFARNGYAALLIDTLQLGEIEGVHHGTCRMNQWWWNSRGYTPAGVEAWFGIRALDYLCSRPEVDAEKIGMTGRSGGGAYTWTVAALDERVKVAAPVAGITDLRNHVVDGVVEGHCDCMFFLNTYGWDYPQAAALLAPRPLLIANTDKDTIFPLDGVIRTYNQVKRVYSLHGKTSQLGLLISEGPHADTQDLQVPVFRWFNRFLKGEQPLISMAAEKLIDPMRLRVFEELPKDELNTAIQNTFGAPAASERKAPAASAAELRDALLKKVFRGWPDPSPGARLELNARSVEGGLRLRWYSLEVQPGESLPLLIASSGRDRRNGAFAVHVIGNEDYTNHPSSFLWKGQGTEEQYKALLKECHAGRAARVYFFPRSVPAPWMSDPKAAPHIRRRYMLLGQTLDGMRVWDIRSAVAALRKISGDRNAEITLHARGAMGVNTAYAALFENARVELQELPASHREGPDYLNVLGVCDIPQVTALVEGL